MDYSHVLTRRLYLRAFNDLDARGKHRLEYHVNQQDYFGTLATVLKLYSDAGDIHGDPFNEVLDELKHLQTNYLIEKK